MLDWPSLSAESRSYARRLVATERDRWLDAERNARGSELLRMRGRADAFAALLVLADQSSPPSSRTTIAPPSNDRSTSSVDPSASSLAPQDLHLSAPRSTSAVHDLQTVRSGSAMPQNISEMPSSWEAR